MRAFRPQAGAAVGVALPASIATGNGRHADGAPLLQGHHRVGAQVQHLCLAVEAAPQPPPGIAAWPDFQMQAVAVS